MGLTLWKDRKGKGRGEEEEEATAEEEEEEGSSEEIPRLGAALGKSLPG